MKGLTDRQSEVLDFISVFLKENCYPPTVREVAEAFGISVKGAYDHLIALQKKEAIRFNPNKSRTIEIVKKDKVFNEETVQIPLLGKIAAGVPIFTEENIERNVSFPASLLKTNSRYFALKIQGDSMINAGILDGDLAIIEHSEVAENGEIVVAVANDAITLKRFYKEANRVRLQPENDNYKPFYFQDVKIAGRLATIIRQY